MKTKGLYKYTGIAIYLLILLSLFTLAYTSDTISKYKSTVQDTTTASVAKWDVSIEPISASNVINMVTGGASQDYLIKVKSLSEVSSYYSIIVTNIPNDVKVSIDNGTEYTPSDNTITFTNVGAFDINNNIKERQHKLTFNAPLESSAANANISIQAAFTQSD